MRLTRSPTGLGDPAAFGGSEVYVPASHPLTRRVFRTKRPYAHWVTAAFIFLVIPAASGLVTKRPAVMAFTVIAGAVMFLLHHAIHLFIPHPARYGGPRVEFRFDEARLVLENVPAIRPLALPWIRRVRSVSIPFADVLAVGWGLRPYRGCLHVHTRDAVYFLAGNFEDQRELERLLSGLNTPAASAVWDARRTRVQLCDLFQYIVYILAMALALFTVAVVAALILPRLGIGAGP